MPNKTYAQLVDRVYPHVPGCPHETIRRAVRDAAISACERTLLWRYHIPLYDLLPGVHEYAFECPDGTAVQAIFAAIVNGTPLALMNLEQAIAAHPAWADLYSGESVETLWSETPSAALNEYTYDGEVFDGITDFVLPDSVIADAGTPLTCTQLTPDKYIVLPLPDDTAYEMRMIVALKPRRDSASMDEHVMNELEDVILHRTIQNLVLLPNVPWTDKEMAVYHGRQYNFHMNERRARANLGNGRSSLSVRSQRWA